MQRAFALALTVTCPKCGADEGDLCHDMRPRFIRAGYIREIARPHRDRFISYNELASEGADRAVGAFE